MNTTVAEGQNNVEVAPNSQTPKPATDANVTPLKAKARPSKAKSARRATRPHKSVTVRNATDTAHPGSKTAKIVGLLRRPKGATLNELMKATGWQPHSVRGFLSGTLGNRMELTVTSAKSDNGERRYSLSD